MIRPLKITPVCRATGLVGSYAKTKINYSIGGITWTFPSAFNAVPPINVSTVLKNLADSIFPISVKITSLTTSAVTIKVYKSVLDANNDIVFSECDTNDIVLHITAGVQ